MNSHVCQVFGVQVFAKLVREAIAAELSRGKERTNVRYTAYKLRVISRCRGGYRDINSRTNVKFLYHGSPFGNFVVCSSAHVGKGKQIIDFARFFPRTNTGTTCLRLSFRLFVHAICKFADKTHHSIYPIVQI